MKELQPIIDKLRAMLQQKSDLVEMNGIALTIMHNTVGENHPVTKGLLADLNCYNEAVAPNCRTVLALYDNGLLGNVRARIAAEIEDDLLDVAEKQLKDAKKVQGSLQEFHLGIAAFLAGAVLEDSLRRLCDKHGATYDPAYSTISKLNLMLYVPSQGIEHITKSESKQVTVWGDTRNKADHGKFSEISTVEVEAMIMGIRAFIAKHLN